MGQQQSKLKDQIKSKYKIVKTMSPGEYLVKSIQKEGELQLRMINFPVQDEMTHFIRLLEKRKKIKNPHLLKLIEYNKVVDQLMCSSTFKLKIIFQFPFKTIKEDMLERMSAAPKLYFAQQQIWSILYSCCHALNSLYLNKFSHESLTTDQIYIDTEGIIKIGDSLLVSGTKNYLHMMGDNLKAQDIRYISPELRNLVDDNNFYKYEKEKSDVFILAMIILQLANLSPLKYYDLKTKRFYFDVVSPALILFKERYSSKLYQILIKMLTSDYDTRPTFEEIIESIEEKTIYTNSNTSSKQSTILNDIKEFSSVPLTRPPGLVEVAQRLNFQKFPVDSVNSKPIPIYQPINPPIMKYEPHNMKFNPTGIQFNQFFQYKPTLLPPKLQFPVSQQAPKTLNWQFDTITKPTKRLQDNNYTPYQELLNLSANATLSKQHATNLAKKQQNYQNTNSISFNLKPSIPMQSIPQNSLKERRFSELKFGSIEINATQSARITEKKPVNIVPNFTEVKGIHLFKQQKLESDNIKQNGTFVIEQQILGDIYEGFKSNNLKNGIGRIIYKDGGCYEGQWKDGKIDGYGKLFYANGKVAYEGHWSNDQFSGTGRAYNEIQDYQASIFVDHKDLGSIDDKWIYFEGEFKNSMKCGRGFIKFITGQKFYGNFESDAIEGQGTFYQKSGKRIEGIWSNNLLISYNLNENNN